MIKLILFDYYGVISGNEHWDFVGGLKNASSELQELDKQSDAGKIAWHDFLKELSQATDVAPADIEEMYKRNLVNRAMVGIISDLKKSYKIALLSNANHNYLEPLLKEVGIWELFDDVIISSRAGVIKPDIRAYHNALNVLGLKADEVLFIDDNLENVAASKTAGIQTILFESAEQLAQELSNRGISVA